MRSKYKSSVVHYSPSKGRELSANEIENYKSFGNISGFTDVIRFDSYHEYQVYQSLKNSQLGSAIIPHYSIPILPPKKSIIFPRGKNWRVDFLVKGYHQEPLLLVEAKGFITREFTLILAMLEKYNPNLFGKLWLIFPDNRIPKKNLITNLRKKQNQPGTPKILTLSQFQELIL